MEVFLLDWSGSMSRHSFLNLVSARQQKFPFLPGGIDLCSSGWPGGYFPSSRIICRRPGRAMPPAQEIKLSESRSNMSTN